MNKNNFISKFAHFYISNFFGIKIIVVDIWDGIADNIEDFIEGFLLFLKAVVVKSLMLAIHIISIVFPLKQIIFTFFVKYLTVEELAELHEKRKEGGYFLKSDIKKQKEQIKAEKGEQL